MITYVFDTTLSDRLTASLRMLLPDPKSDEPVVVVEHDVQHIGEEEGFSFEIGTALFLPTLKERGRILVTCLSASKRKQVSSMIGECGLRAVHLAEGFSQLPIFTQASKLMGCWEKIVHESYRLKTSESIAVGVNGAIK